MNWYNLKRVGGVVSILLIQLKPKVIASCDKLIFYSPLLCRQYQSTPSLQTLNMSLVPTSIQGVIDTANSHRELKVVTTSHENNDFLENRFVVTGFSGAFKITFAYKVGGKLVTNMNTAVSKATCEMNVKLECEIDQEMIGAILTSAANDEEHRIKQVTRFMDTLGAFMLHISKRNVSPEDHSVRMALLALVNAAGHIADAIADGSRHLLPMEVSSAAYKAITHKKFQASGVARTDNIVDVEVKAPAAAPKVQAKNPFDCEEDLIDFGRPQLARNTLPVIFNPFE